MLAAPAVPFLDARRLVGTAKEVSIAIIAAGGSVLGMYVLGAFLLQGSERLAQAHQAGLATHGAAIKEAAQPVAWGVGTAAWGLAAAGTGLLGRMLAKLKGPTS